MFEFEITAGVGLRRQHHELQNFVVALLLLAQSETAGVGTRSGQVRGGDKIGCGEGEREGGYRLEWILFMWRRL